MIPVLIFSILFPLQSAYPLQSMQWKKRVLLIDGPVSEAAALYDDFMKYPEEVSDRDMLILTWRGNKMLSFPEDPSSGLKGEMIRQHYQLTGENRVILIGKDGEIKLDKSADVICREIFDLIDSMPMRRMETRLKGG